MQQLLQGHGMGQGYGIGKRWPTNRLLHREGKLPCGQDGDCRLLHRECGAGGVHVLDPGAVKGVTLALQRSCSPPFQEVAGETRLSSPLSSPHGKV